MKVSQREYDVLINLIAADYDGDIRPPTIESIVSRVMEAFRITVDDARRCEAVAEQDDEVTWVSCTWRDAVVGDVVRPDGQADEQHAAVVIAAEPVQHWHARWVSWDNPNLFYATRQPRSSQQPHEWSMRAVTIEPLAGGDPVLVGGEAGVNPDAPIEIRVTAGEHAAIMALGGWGNRIAVMDTPLDTRQ